MKLLSHSLSLLSNEISGNSIDFRPYQLNSIGLSLIEFDCFKGRYFNRNFDRKSSEHSRKSIEISASYDGVQQCVSVLVRKHRVMVWANFSRVFWRIFMRIFRKIFRKIGARKASGRRSNESVWARKSIGFRWLELSTRKLNDAKFSI